jgi:hypothetical protein
MRWIFLIFLILSCPLVVLGVVIPKDKAAKILKAYPEADTDENGELSFEELEKAIPQLPQKFQKPVQAYVKRVRAQQKGSNSSNLAPKASLLNYEYGAHERQVFDLYLADSENPTPLVLFIHGGGFKKGDKSKYAKNSLLKQLLDKGISCAATNYRFFNQNEAGLLGCMMDSKRALQTIRYHAEKWNIDKDRILLYGGSAGAGTSMWIGFRDEMANSESEDPIERESTRVKGIVATAIQATYHFERWPEILNSKNKPEPQEKNEMYASPANALLALNASHSIQRELDHLEWLSSDDPPLYVVNQQKDSQLDLSNPKHRGPSLHHPLHAKAIADQAERVGLKDCYIYAPGIQLKPHEDIDILEFILKYI